MLGSVDVDVDGTAPPSVDLAEISSGNAKATIEWALASRPTIDAALTKHGSLYFRNGGIVERDDFATLRDALFIQRAHYREKATPRTDFGADVYSSTDFPPSQPIRLHNENSYALTFPGKLLFGCIAAPDQGGATTVADVRAVLRAVPASINDRMSENGWRLIRVYNELVGLPWQTAFGTDDRREVERYCEENAITCSWNGDQLRTEQRRPAIISHPSTGEYVWFNHAAFWSEWSLPPAVRDVLVDDFGREGLPFQTTYGDGADLPADDVAEVNRAYENATRRRAWRPGDFLLVDNVLSAHGRDAFAGRREILVAMGEPTTLADCTRAESEVNEPST